MEISFFQIVLLALIQGAAELLPISSSAHVIMAERLMHLDPSSPSMTFLLVMLHTGTMLAVLLYFWPRWKKLDKNFLKMVVLATGVTGIIGLGLKKFIEKVILGYWLGESNAEIEHLFRSLPLMAVSLFSVGALIVFSGLRADSQTGLGADLKAASGTTNQKNFRELHLSPISSTLIGIVQGLCLPFRGFSRSGATISTGLILNLSQGLAEDFSFALAVMLTPPVVLLELHRLLKALGPAPLTHFELGQQILPGIVGMVFSFGSGLLALRWLSHWLEMGRWKFFGGYCMVASLGVALLHSYWF